MEVFSVPKKNNNRYLEIQLKEFRKNDKADFRGHQQINLGESDFKQLVQLRNRIVAAWQFSKDENPKHLVTKPVSRGLEEQLRHDQMPTQLWIDSKVRTWQRWRNTTWTNQKAVTCKFDFWPGKVKGTTFNKLFLLSRNWMKFYFCLMFFIRCLTKLCWISSFVTLLIELFYRINLWIVDKMSWNKRE